ncbi:MAG: hypothetical protein PWQ89_1793, partial [Verrucomicrobiota bacterium]|nr:hypothetical protein [Verrucomicrobiota bacterium]
MRFAGGEVNKRTGSDAICWTGCVEQKDRRKTNAEETEDLQRAMHDGHKMFFTVVFLRASQATAIFRGVLFLSPARSAAHNFNALSPFRPAAPPKPHPLRIFAQRVIARSPAHAPSIRFARRPLRVSSEKSGCLSHQKKQFPDGFPGLSHDKRLLQTQWADTFPSTLFSQRGIYR